MTQTVNQRNTLGVLTASPTAGVSAGSTVTFNYMLNTAGAPAPTSETIQFMDNAAALGSPQALNMLAGSNLLPYSQIVIGSGWAATGANATVTPNAVAGPDGSSSSATQIAFPVTATSGVTAAVPGTAYANQTLTFSVWAKAAATVSLTLSLADSPSVAASGSNTCALTTSWQRCSFTLAFPSNAGTGFAATLSTAGQATSTVSLWGAQVESATTPGPYVSTIGTARPTGGQGATVTFPYSLFHNGSHSITAVYSGDANFVASTSNAVALTVSQATPSIAFTANPVSSSTYGSTVTLTATLGAPSGDPADIPVGTVQFFDGATLLGTGTLNSSGVASLNTAGASSLSGGSHVLTAVYSGSTEFTAVTSTTLSYSIGQVSNAVTITATSSRNPSAYGDAVVLSVTLASNIGAAVPTGSVSIVDTSSTTTLGTITLDSAGAGTLTLPLLTAGSHPLTITYSGDANYH